MKLVLLSRLGRTPTFLVPIINPPFADTAGTPPSPEKEVYYLQGAYKYTGRFEISQQAINGGKLGMSNTQ
jgi:hypothetical protein